ncbi:MAG: sulfur carrier protein ThiS [Acidimicrobiales bacterium]
MNGQDQDVEDRPSVDAVVVGLGRGRAGLAVAVNSEIVPRSRWDSTRLAEGDRIEILEAAQGG